MLARRSGGKGLAPAESAATFALAAGRLAIGAGIWLAPGPALKALGLDGLDAKALAVARIAATRDLALGAWMAASAGERRALRGAAAAAAACDAGDTLAFALLARTGGENAGAGMRGVAAAAPATAAGTWLLLRLRASS